MALNTLLLLAAFATRQTGLGPGAIEIYFVRHGETVSNATGRYNEAGLNTLTKAGTEQAAAVERALARVPFDSAIVSPSLRAELTAAPTLRAHHLVATIWPEFNECCTEHGAARRRPPSRELPRDGKVHVPKSLESLLKANPYDDRMCAPADYADGLSQVRTAASLCRAMVTHAFRSGEVYRLLIVGHAAQGSRFLDAMLGRKPVGDIELKNGVIVILRSERGGPFKLMRKIENPVASHRLDPRMR